MRIISIFLLFILVGCTSQSAKEQRAFKDSLRTDGVYESNGEVRDFGKVYVRFFISNNGDKQFKTMLMKEYSANTFEQDAAVVDHFSVRPGTHTISYDLIDGGMQVNSATNFDNFRFIPDKP